MDRTAEQIGATVQRGLDAAKSAAIDDEQDIPTNTYAEGWLAGHEAARDRVAATIGTIEAELQTEQVRAVRACKQHVTARLEGARQALAALDDSTN